MSEEVTLICVPGDAYKGMPIEEVARRYTDMSDREFHEIVGMPEDYLEEWGDKPDFYWGEVFEKEGTGLDYSVFADQDVISVNGLGSGIKSSSYILTPECDLKDGDKQLYLPDLEAIEIKGHPLEVDMMVRSLTGLYRDANNWEVEPLSMAPSKFWVFPNTERIKGKIGVASPMGLMHDAARTTSYRLDGLGF